MVQWGRRRGREEDPAAEGGEDPATGADEAERDARATAGEADDSPRGEDAETIDISETTAPSIGPNTVIEKDPPEERLERHEQSDVDAMGLDKRRQVIGGNYSASFARQATMYAIFVAVVLGLGFGLKTLADELDKPDPVVQDRAPWASPEASQRPPVRPQ